MDNLTTLTTTKACTVWLLRKLQENIELAPDDASLKDSEQVDQIRKDVVSGLKNIDRSGLSDKLKLWCMQFGLLPPLMFLITIN